MVESNAPSPTGQGSALRSREHRWNSAKIGKNSSPLKDDPKFSNEFDTFRKNICKKILERRNKENEEDQKFNNLFKKRKRDNSNNNRNDKMKNKNNNSNNNNNSKKKKK